MILHSVALMTLFDVFMICVTGVAVFYYFKYFQELGELKFVSAVGAIVVGLIVLCSTYVLDFLFMHVFPLFTSYQKSDNLMNKLYMDWNWWITAFGVGVIVFGVAYLTRNLVPHTKTLMAELKKQKQELTRSLDEQHELERQLRNLRDSLEEKNISKAVELDRTTRQLAVEVEERRKLEEKLSQSESDKKSA